jgi:amino acid transporter
MPSEEAERTTALALEERSKLRKTLRRLDLVGFTLCALVGLDTLGSVASHGGAGFTWLFLLSILFLFPYALVMAELGSTFTQEGGPYQWTKLAFGRFWAGITAVFYWITNPFWVGGSLAFAATDAWSKTIHPIVSGSAADYAFKLVFIWVSIGVAIAALEQGKWIPNLGAITRVFVLGFFSLTVTLYACVHGVHGWGGTGWAPTAEGFFALVPILLFNYVGFELQSGAAEEMVDPQRDVPVSVLQSALVGVGLYCIPVFGILAVLPPSEVSGVGGFIDAVSATFTVYGSAQRFLLPVMTVAFVFALLTSGSVWMIGSDRVQAVAAYDGAFWGWFGVFSARFGTPVRVNVLSGAIATLFMVCAVGVFHGGTDAAFKVVLNIAISTTLLSYLVIVPAVIKLRYTHPHAHRPYRVPFGTPGVWTLGVLVTAWMAVGAWETLVPATLGPLLGVTAGDFVAAWGVTRLRFEVLTLTTLGAVAVLAALGYRLGAPVRRREITIDVVDAAHGRPASRRAQL